MKAIVVACLEPEHLEHCLQSLDLWLLPQDVIVLNNANQTEHVTRIAAIAARHRMETMRLQNHTHGENTLPYIHQALCNLSRAHPGETILKIDEDIMLVAKAAQFEAPPGAFVIPNITINNFTTKNYLAEFQPALHAKVIDHPWLWHFPHPRTGVDYREALFRFIYEADPLRFMEHCARNAGKETVIGRSEWEKNYLWSRVDDAHKRRGGWRLMPKWFVKKFRRASTHVEHRGISSTAMSFRADDYLALVGKQRGIEEVLIAEAVYHDRARYVVKHDIFCHHVNYWSVREMVKQHAALVAGFCERLLTGYRSCQSTRVS